MNAPLSGVPASRVQGSQGQVSAVEPGRQSAPRGTRSAEAGHARPERSTWGFESGESIRPGLVAVKRLGGGSRYEVYLAIEERRLAMVVAKLIRPEYAGQVHASADLELEAEMLSSLAHPGIPRLLDAVLGERPLLLLEQIEGPTLRRVIKRSGASIEQTVPLALHLASVLHYLGCEGVVHLDVKPNNIIMAAPPRLIDLSVARRLQGPRPPKRGLGTPPYMAPEQLIDEGFGPIGTATDMWGFGVTIYEACAGRRPFPDAELNPDSWIVLPARADKPPQLRHAPTPLPGWVPPVLADVVHACLAWDPADRPTPFEVALALEPLVADITRAPRMWGRRRVRR